MHPAASTQHLRPPHDTHLTSPMQAMNIGVALPDFMFAKDRKMAAVMLISLVGCGEHTGTDAASSPEFHRGGRPTERKGCV